MELSFSVKVRHLFFFSATPGDQLGIGTRNEKERFQSSQGFLLAVSESSILKKTGDVEIRFPTAA